MNRSHIHNTLIFFATYELRLGWARFDWVRLGQVVLCCIGLGVVLVSFGLVWFGWVGLGWVGLGQGQVGLGWLGRVVLVGLACLHLLKRVVPFTLFSARAIALQVFFFLMKQASLLEERSNRY